MVFRSNDGATLRYTHCVLFTTKDICGAVLIKCRTRVSSRPLRDLWPNVRFIRPADNDSRGPRGSGLPQVCFTSLCYFPFKGPLMPPSPPLISHLTPCSPSARFIQYFPFYKPLFSFLHVRVSSAPCRAVMGGVWVSQDGE